MYYLKMLWSSFYGGCKIIMPLSKYRWVFISIVMCNFIVNKYFVFNLRWNMKYLNLIWLLEAALLASRDFLFIVNGKYRIIALNHPKTQINMKISPWTYVKLLLNGKFSRFSSYRCLKLLTLKLPYIIGFKVCSAN